MLRTSLGELLNISYYGLHDACVTKYHSSNKYVVIDEYGNP